MNRHNKLFSMSLAPGIAKQYKRRSVEGILSNVITDRREKEEAVRIAVQLSIESGLTANQAAEKVKNVLLGGQSLKSIKNELEGFKMDKQEEFIRSSVLTFLKKNKDYGDSFKESLDTFGFKGYQVRAYDKLQRLQSLLDKDDREVEDEKLEDTALDLFIYSCMARSYESDRGFSLFGVVDSMYYFLEDWFNLFDYLEDKDLIGDDAEYVPSNYKPSLPHNLKTLLNKVIHEDQEEEAVGRGPLSVKVTADTKDLQKQLEEFKKRPTTLMVQDPGPEIIDFKKLAYETVEAVKEHSRGDTLEDKAREAVTAVLKDALAAGKQ